MDKLKEGFTLLAAKLKAYRSQSATYRRGAKSIAGLKVTVGQTEPKASAEAGAQRIRSNAKDFVVTAADLDFADGAGVFDPRPGDTIELVEQGVTKVYEVCPLDDDGLHVRRDRYGVSVRIHTKFLKDA